MRVLSFALLCAAAATTALVAAAADTAGASAPFTFTPLGQALPDGADPTAVALPDGRVRIYFSSSTVSHTSAISSDGIHFTAEPGERLPGSAYPGHSRIVRLPDGRWRMFFSITRPADAPPGIGSAVSSNGLDFTVEPGLRVSTADAGFAPPKGLSAGDVVHLPDGRYRMYFSSFTFGPRDPATTHEVVKSAISSDRSTWTVEPGIRVGGTTGVTSSTEHPAAIVLPGGETVLFYGSVARRDSSGKIGFGVYMASSADGLTFTSDVKLVDESLDSAVVPQPDGSYLVYYGQYDPATGISSVDVGRLTFPVSVSAPTSGCTVPNAIGMRLAAARAAIVRAGCGLGRVQRAYSAKVAAGAVVSERPAAGALKARGAKVELVVSRGRRR